MGAELCKLEKHEIYVVLDNTSDMVKEFNNFETCIKAFEFFGRELKRECMVDYVIEFFEYTMEANWDEGDLEEELKKINLRR